eukprot:3840988-Pleurochrysis_carterae.AAC.1
MLMWSTPFVMMRDCCDDPNAAKQQSDACCGRKSQALQAEVWRIPITLRGVWACIVQHLPSARSELKAKLSEIAKRLELINVYSLRDEEGSSFEASVLDAIVQSFVLKVTFAIATATMLKSLLLPFALLLQQETQLQRLEKRKLRDRPVLSLVPATPPHVDSRSQANPEYPARSHVPDAKVRWDVDWPEYQPVPFTHADVRSNARDLDTGHKWADPELSP